MLNKDINARFEDWLLSPSEGLDFEVKRWLDMTDRDSHGILAKALTVDTGGTFSQAMLQDLPSDVVKQLTAPLFLHFDMLKLPDAFYTDEIENMRNGRA